MRWLFLVFAFTATAHAGSLPRTPGMYTTNAQTSLPMLDSKIAITVRGPIVETTITQTFKNDSPDATEATYIFPLPADAAVSAMSIDLGTRKIHAAIEKREQAKARYEEAVAHGLGAGILEQERPDVFTQTVSAIPARGTATVTLRYDSVASYSDGTWTLVTPLVVAPRFTPGSASGRPTTGTGKNPDTDRAPDASRVTPHTSTDATNSAAIAIDFATPVESVTSPSHNLDSKYRVTAKADRDLVVRWKAARPIDGWIEAEPGGGGFAAALITGPAAQPHKDPARLRIVVDHSATTRGDAETVERGVTRALINALAATDRAGTATGELVAPKDLQLEQQRGVFDLTRVLAGAKPNGVALVVITDGLVADDSAAIAAAKKLGVPVHVIGIGTAPNRSLCAAIAAETGGTTRFAFTGDDLDALARDLVSDIANQPPALAVSWGELQATDVVPAHLPRVGAGQATLVLARVKQVKAANVRARGDVLALSSFTATPAPAGATSVRGSLARRWAKLRLDDLVRGTNPRAAIDHAIQYGLVSPYTAMVAIGDEVIVEGGVKKTRGVPVALPAGMQWQPVERETTLSVDQPKTDKNATEAKPPTSSGKKRPEPKRDTTGISPDEERNGATVSGSTSVENTYGDGDKAAAKPAKKEKKADYDGADDDEDDAKDSRRKHFASKDTAAAPPAAPTPMDEAMAGETVTEVNGTVSTGSHRYLDLAIAGGAGLSRVHSETYGSALLRIEAAIVIDRLLAGIEGSLWLGSIVEGSINAQVTTNIAPHTQLGGGIGVHVGNDVGPAIDLELRHRFTDHVWLYLRYDGALLLRDTTHDGQNTGSLGLELHF
ncbi:MAG: VIT domain-containing protein [Kofleriaceae bacterium]